MTNKALDVTSVADALAGKVPDLQVIGDGDMWTLICKASSQQQGWMKSTKAYEVAGLGCLVQVSTQQGDQVAEAVVFVPDAKINIDPRGNPYLRRR